MKRETIDVETLRSLFLCNAETGELFWKWGAVIRAGGKQINLGSFDLKADAIAARKAAEIEHGYHQNHGRQP